MILYSDKLLFKVGSSGKKRLLISKLNRLFLESNELYAEKCYSFALCK
ncbi:hypothetical protein HMPREF1981_01693 [Bacteroides pyogenes F0041]|uniref:Uncharacterized protein n=1 Tax=Bacteroides pyogenes F0041 TaxID=1321819 RepID=U2CN73_9BACE|nr:hypothetical protein HMPREF1981_01693 [Bacteroides pyogenes F0041]